MSTMSAEGTTLWAGILCCRQWRIRGGAMERVSSGLRYGP